MDPSGQPVHCRHVLQCGLAAKHSKDQPMYEHPLQHWVTTTNLISNLPGYRHVWYHASGIANFLSLARVKDQYRVMYDSEGGNEFKVTKPDGLVCAFKESPCGLYYMDTADYANTGTRDSEQVLVTLWWRIRSLDTPNETTPMPS